MLFGAHLSVSGGYPSTVRYALEVGAECMQVFAKSPRQWRSRPIDPDKASQFSELRHSNSLGPLFTHTAYLINLAATDKALRAKSIDALADELTRARLLGAKGVVTHVGSDPERDQDRAARRAADAIAAAVEISRPLEGCRLLLENTAGAGSTFGSTFQEIAAIINALPDHLRTTVGMCLDTCHAHAFGMDLTSETGWSSTLDTVHSTIGLQTLGLIHANDCAFERGSKRDRHAWLGKGLIGVDGFEAMVCEPRLAAVPVITEMPGDVPDKDIVNISLLKNLRDICSQR